MSIKAVRIYLITLLVSYLVAAGFFNKLNLRKWLVRIKGNTFTHRSITKSSRSSNFPNSWSSSEIISDTWSSPELEALPIDNLVEDSWGDSWDSPQACNCQCMSGGDNMQKGKGKGKKGGKGTMAIVVPRYEYFDVPMAKEIKSESLGPLTEKEVSFKGKGWGW